MANVDIKSVMCLAVDIVCFGIRCMQARCYNTSQLFIFCFLLVQVSNNRTFQIAYAEAQLGREKRQLHGKIRFGFGHFYLFTLRSLSVDSNEFAQYCLIDSLSTRSFSCLTSSFFFQFIFKKTIAQMWKFDINQVFEIKHVLVQDQIIKNSINNKLVLLN